MRKKPLLIIVVLLLTTLCGVLFFACTDETEKGNPVVELKIISDALPEFVLGEPFDINDIKLKATYADGKSYEISLDNSMLSEEDRGKFFLAGVHSVTVNYGGKQAVLQLKITEKSQDKYYTAEFYSNGGNEVPSQYTDVIKSIITPTRAGYTFMGWYASSSFEGNRMVTPYELKENTKFYAKWEDNRRCVVKFLDGEEVVNSLTVVYGTGIDITDLVKYPAPAEKEGMRFNGWSSKSGSSLTEIVSDVEIVANYERVNCTVTITYLDDASKEQVTRPRTLKYGEYFDVSQYTMPTKEGHTSRWVYRRSSDSTHEPETFPTDGEYRVVEDIVITAAHTINTYSITIYNGATNQSYANLKNNDIKLDRVYNGNEDYTVKYGEDFDIKEFVSENLNLTEPATVSVGYAGEWCFAILNERGEITLRNAQNKIWSDEENAFVLAKKSDGTYEEATSEFDLTDRDGNYLAHVSRGNLKNIKGNVTIRAKYYKKEYKVTLYRRQDSNWMEIDSFTEEFLADFDLYDPSKYVRDKDEGKDFESKNDVENYYRLHNVAAWSKASENTTVYDLWSTIYKNGNRSDQNFDDWAVEWFTNSSLNESVKVDFTNGTHEVQGNVSLYCNDLDLRRYDVTLLYDYNFAAKSTDAENYYGYNKDKIRFYPELQEKETLSEPEDARNPIVRTYTDANGVSSNVTYTFAGWYDYPYVPEDRADSTGFTGNAYNTLDVRTHSMVYYAHYRCNVTYTLTVHDKTQQEAYKKTDYNGKGYDVAENTVVYKVAAGSVVTSDMLYKGKVNADGTITSGQYFYDRFAYAREILGDGDSTNPQGTTAKKYNELVALYGGGDKPSAISRLNSLIKDLENRINSYEQTLGYMYSYDYENLTEESFLNSYLTVNEYHEKRNELQRLNNELELIEKFADYVIEADEYRTESADYHAYATSEADLNNAYGKAEGEIKYRFSGWYTNSEYSALFTQNRTMEFSWLAVNKDMDLYAKWADEEKGSEGLVFKKVADNDGNILGLVVVDFMTKADYEASAFNGCGYNDFVNYDYSVNFNDQDEMPVSLGTNLDIQIPAAHGGEGTIGYPIIGILRNAFARHGKDIVSMNLPNDIKFIEEGAFIGCNLSIISGVGDYIEAVDERAVYQKRDYSVNEYSAKGNTLIAYANRFAGENNTVLTLENGTVRIADYAFYGAIYLKTVDFGSSLISIGDGAFEDSALNGSVTAGTLVLPDGFKQMGAFAFKNCADIEYIEHGAAIDRVGRQALTTTKWFTKQTGLITLNGLVVGLRGAVEGDLDADENGRLTETELPDGTMLNSYTNAYGVLYYSAETHVLIAVTVTNADGIAEYAFEDLQGAVAEIRVETSLAKYGIANCAFKNCVNLTDIYLDLNCKVANDVFDGCARVRIHNEGSGRDASWDGLGNKAEFVTA